MTTRLDPLQHAWMTAPATLAVMNALGHGNARFVGGVVRNSLLGEAVSDIDIATLLVPAEVVKRLAAAGIKAVPTGIEHGTITAVTHGKPFEVTSLRRDITTDGRRATVAFTTDWREDASRRDFTMNALYADMDGAVFDYFGGLDDLKAGRVKFVGDAPTRIREDYLRSLRLFRFHAWYGRGVIDADALKAARAERAGLAQLSGERIQKEMFRLFAAANPVASLRAMAEAGVLGEILPGSPDFARLERLVATDGNLGFAVDPLMRLFALVAPDENSAGAICTRWKLSAADCERLKDFAREKIETAPGLKDARKLLYRLGLNRFVNRMRLFAAKGPAEEAESLALIAKAEALMPPPFPLAGRDALEAGIPHGPEIGRLLSEIERAWIDADFVGDAPTLREQLKRAAGTQ